MATYKVLQDIEAEDKILGPLTLRQFIFGLITAFLLYINFIVITKGAPYLLVILLPPTIFTGFFAFPFGGDQPTEVWALAKIRFYFKPRKRLWDQSGVKELVTITVPKKVERILTNGLSASEVQSRLKALSTTIDSRGWAVKNVNVNLYSQPNAFASEPSDRLIDVSAIPQEVPNYDVQAADDILDETNNPIAQQFESMINASEQTHRKQLVDELNDIRSQQDPKPQANNDYWFMNQPSVPANLPESQTMFTSDPVVQPGGLTPTTAATPTADEQALADQIKAQHDSQNVSYSHLRTIQPLSEQAAAQTAPPTGYVPAPTTMTPAPDPAILSLANNDDLNVSTLAREAYKAKNPDRPPEDEVVISLH